MAVSGSRASWIVALAVGMSSLGCGGGSYNSGVSVKAPEPIPVIKTVQSISESGELGSGMMEVESQLEQLKKANSPQAPVLEAGIAALKAADGNPDQVKQVAAELVIKLNTAK